MKIEKYHFFWIVPVITIFTGLVGHLHERQKHKDTIISLLVKVRSYDQFQLYFIPSDETAYSEKNSIRRNIIGMNGEQRILFHLPDSISITNLKLRIGRDSKQEFVEVRSVKFEVENNSVSVPHTELIPNSFIRKSVNNQYYTQAINDSFEPCLEFSKQAIDSLDDLKNRVSINILYIVLVVSFLTAVLWFLNDLIHFNKYSVYYLSMGLIAFYLLVLAFDKLKKDGEMVVSMEAIVKKDDIFEVLVLPEKEDAFSSTYSTRRKIVGAREIQKIEFSFPDTAEIKKIRIDLGENSDQLPIKIVSLSIKRENEFRLMGEDVFNVFALNDFVTRQDNLSTLKTIKRSDSYSPYDPFISSTDISVYLDDLGKSKSSPILLYIVSFLLISVGVFHLIFNTSSDVPHQRILEYGFSFFFLLLLLLPSFDQVFHFRINRESSEKRGLREKPIFRFDQITTYPKAFENYYNDNFGFRNVLIRLGGNFKNIFKASPVPQKAMIGKENWIFLNGEVNNVSQDIKRGNLLSDQQLKEFIARCVQRRDTLRRKNIKYYKAFWPDKHTIYPEYLPLAMSIQLKDTLSKSDQMVSALKNSNSEFEIIDVRKELLDGKRTAQLYLKNDSHWNDYGAFLAYHKLMSKISLDFPSIRPKELKDFNITWSESEYGDLLEIMGMKHSERFVDQVPSFVALTETEITLLPTDLYPPQTLLHKNGRSTNSLRVVIFRDSYTRALTKFISPHFQEVLYIWTGYDQSIVDKYKPDIVIECFVERYFE